jgi:hypothetical protein
MKFKFEDFCDAAPTVEELSPDTPLWEKVAVLELEVANLKVRLQDRDRNLKASEQSILDWFREDIKNSVNAAAEKLKTDVVITSAFKEHIQQAVEVVFERNAQELFNAVVKAVVAKIQPYALKQQ